MSLLLDNATHQFADLFETYRKNTVRELFRLVQQPLPVSVARATHAVVSLVRDGIRSHPQQILTLLNEPTTSTLIFACNTELRSDHPSQPFLKDTATQLCAQILCQLSRSHLLPPSGAYLPLQVAHLLCPDIGVVVVPDHPCHAARFRNGEVLLDITSAPKAATVQWTHKSAMVDGPVSVSQGYIDLGETLRLALVDNNPIWDLEAHPDKHGNALDLGDRPHQEWSKTLTDALALVELILPSLKAEIDRVLRLIVPCGFDDQRHLSASYKEAVGIVYMTLHPRLLTMVEALIHEFQHNKLNAVTHTDPLLLNAFEPIFRSPVRPDPRPLHGVLLAAHAFLPVAELYFRLIAHHHPLASSGGFEDRLRTIVRLNMEACETLRAANPTALGQQLLEEMWSMSAQHQEQLKMF